MIDRRYGIPTRRRPEHRAGIALILAVGTLAVMATFALTFAVTVRMERRASRTSEDRTRARGLAESGFEIAARRIQEDWLEEPWTPADADWLYRANEDSIDEQVAVGVVVPSTLSGDLGAGTPIETADRLSYRMGRTVSGYPYSGLLRGTYLPDGDLYAVKILDTTSMIHVNGGRLSGYGHNDPSDPDNARIARILNFLGDYLGITVDTHDLGDRIVAGRPEGGYASKADLIPAIGEEAYATLRDFVTCHAWVDPDTVRPNPAVTTDGMVGPEDAGNRQAFALEPEPRAPVNINTASIPVLAAVLRGIRADSYYARYWYYLQNDRVYHRRTPEIGREPGLNLAGEIVKWRSERGAFRGWSDFITMLNERGGARTVQNSYQQDGDRVSYAYTTYYQALGYSAYGGVEALMANADPNTSLHGFDRLNPVLSAYEIEGGPRHTYRVDKTMLLAHSTEFCFAPTGIFDITALGRVVDDRGIVAEGKVSGVVRVGGIVRQTTQGDFESVRADDASVSLTFPEPGGVAAAAWDGGVQLRPRSLPSATGRTAAIPFDAQVDPAALRMEAGGAVLEPTEDSDYVERASVLGHGRVTPEGLAASIFSRNGEEARHLVFPGHGVRSLKEGTVEFWFKPYWDGYYGTDRRIRSLFYHRVCLDGDRSLTLEISAVNRTLISSIRYYDRVSAATSLAEGPYGAIDPSWIVMPEGVGVSDEQADAELVLPQYEARATIGPVRQEGSNSYEPYQMFYPGEWHHVAVVWKNVSEHVLYLDGVAYPAQLLAQQDDEGDWVLIEPLEYLGRVHRSETQVGMQVLDLVRENTAFAEEEEVDPFERVAAFAEGTIDDVVLHDAPRYPTEGVEAPTSYAMEAQFVPERYADGTFTARLDRADLLRDLGLPAGFAGGLRIGSFFWTERNRATYYVRGPNRTYKPDASVRVDLVDPSLGVLNASAETEIEITDEAIAALPTSASDGSNPRDLAESYQATADRYEEYAEMYDGYADRYDGYSETYAGYADRYRGYATRYPQYASTYNTVADRYDGYSETYAGNADLYRDYADRYRGYAEDFLDRIRELLRLYAPGGGTDPAGFAVDLPLGVGEELQYVFTMTAGGGYATPAVDDVTVTVGIPIRILSWRPEEPRVRRSGREAVSAVGETAVTFRDGSTYTFGQGRSSQYSGSYTYGSATSQPPTGSGEVRPPRRAPTPSGN